MSTRSRIGIVKDNGTVESIYCHWDGYPSHNGAILLESYLEEEKVKALIALGSISSLGPKVKPSPRKPHSFGNPQAGVVVAYARDRGEELQPARVDASVEAFIASDIEEWGYLFKDGTWYVVDGHEDADKRSMEELTDKYINKRS